MSVTTWDPANVDPEITLSGGNLVATSGLIAGGANARVLGTVGRTHGKKYFELTVVGSASLTGKPLSACPIASPS